MNTAIISGRLVRDAVVNGGEIKAIQFTVAAKYGYDAKEKASRVEFVPCVVFGASKGLEEQLTQKGKGTFVEFEGRIASSSYQKDGKTKYATNVIVNNRTLSIISVREPLPL